MTDATAVRERGTSAPSGSATPLVIPSGAPFATPLTSPPSIVASLGVVVAFWWAATGLTLAMQRTSTISAVSVATASVLAVVGSWMILHSRNATTVRGVRQAFLGASLVWWWCSTIFYAGFGIHLTPGIGGAPRTFSLALDAIRATLLPDLVGVAALVLVAMGVWRHANRVALWALCAFWGTLQTAKINVFMGVRNTGVDWLPPHLADLSQYFGPPHNSPLLPVTVVALCAGLLPVVVNGRRASQPYARHASAMIAFLLVLAVLEHVMLGVDFTLPFWSIFMPTT